MAFSRERSAGELADAFSVTRPAISQHIRVLVTTGLLRERRDGQRRLYQVDAGVVGALRREFDAFWARGLARLASVVEADIAERTARGKGATQKRGATRRTMRRG
jgi:DNA-binding transcriptional ArsR family regulator